MKIDVLREEVKNNHIPIDIVVENDVETGM